MKKKIGIIFLLIPFFARSQIKIMVTLADTPVWNTKLVPADLKYNKWGHFDFTQDDRGNGALDASAYMGGGTAFGNKISYPGLTFTDGANIRARNIFYSGSVATNAWWNTDTTQDWSVNPGAMTWHQMATVVSRNWSILDHGAFHGISNPGATALGFTTLHNAAANRNYTYRNLAAQGYPYVMRFGVVPSNDPDYHSAWEQLSYPGGTSENQFDGYPAEPFAEWTNNGLAVVTNFKNDDRYHVQARRFKDLTAEDAVKEYETFFDRLFAQSSSTVKNSLSYFIHQWDFARFRTIMDYFHKNSKDHFWVCGMQEFYEYFQTIQQTAITQTISGNVLTVTLDQRFLPDEQRWRDMSFLLSSNRSIKNVIVTGADDYSYNTNTGLINIYKKKTKGFAVPPNYNSTGFVFNKKLPLELNDFYIDNNYDNKPEALIDGNISTQFHAKNYDNAMIYAPYEVVADLSDYGAVVRKVRIYGNGKPVTTQVILTRNDNEAETIIGTFTGEEGWQEFVVEGNKFVASRLMLRSNSTAGFGNELEVYADYLPYKEQTYAHRRAPLGDMLGVNAHWWNFVTNTTGNPVTSLVENKIRAFDSLGLRSLRNYGSVEFYQNETGSMYAFNPVMQGWYEDAFMKRLKKDNPRLTRWSVLQGQTKAVKATWEVPDTTKQMTGTVVSYNDKQGWGVLTIRVTSAKGNGLWTNWFIDAQTGNANHQISGSWIIIPSSFPSDQTFTVGAHVPYKTGDRIVVRARHSSQLNYLYANNSNEGRSALTTWDSLARLAYVWSARKGTNRNATKFSSFTSAKEPWLNNNDSIALGSSEWIEVMNEPNASWSGYDDYLNGQHLAKAWSKIYDNHKTFSTEFGVKNADPNMMVSSSGLAISTVDLNRSADWWARKNRGSRPKADVSTQPAYWRAKTFGWTDNPYDVIQFHNYSYTGGSDQFAGGINAGLPPELSYVLKAVDEFVWFRNKYAPWALVDVGEWGYDINPNSPMNAPAIDRYNAEQVRGAWAIRTLLEYNAHGVDKAQWYRLYMDNESDSSNPTQFASMSLLKYNNDGTIRRRVVGNYFRQLSDFGDYVFDTTLRNDSLHVLRFKKDKYDLYAIWSVEKMCIQQGQRPVFINRTAIYNLSLPSGSRIRVKKFQDNEAAMSDNEYMMKGNSYPVKYDLKPVFVVVSNH